MNARSLFGCGCAVVVLGVLAAGGGAIYFWNSVPGEGFTDKLEAVVEGMQPVEARLLGQTELEGGGRLLHVELYSPDGWDVVELAVSAELWRDTPDGSIASPVPLHSAPPRAPGREPCAAVFGPVTGAAVEAAAELRLRIDARAEKHGGSTNVSMGYTRSVPLAGRSAGWDEAPHAADPHADEPR